MKACSIFCCRRCKMLKVEIIRFLAEMRFYRQMLIGNLLSALLVVGGIFYIVSLLGEAGVSSLAALMFWMYASIPLSRISTDIWEKCSSGIFEQMYLHTTQPAFVLLLRMGIYFIQQTLSSTTGFLGAHRSVRSPLVGPGCISLDWPHR
jgi:ABC-2 type transport system permease protein